MALIERDTEIPLKSSLTQHYDLNSRLEKNEEDDLNVDHNHINTPRKYVPLDRIYSASSLCVSSTSVSKKVKARILMSPSPPPIRVYSRRPKRDRDRDCSRSPPSKSFYDSLLARGEDDEENSVKKGKKRRIGSGELVKLGVDSDGIGLDFDKPRLRDCRSVNFAKNGDNVGLVKKKKKKKPGVGSDIGDSVSLSVKSRKWVRLSFDGADPKKFVGLQCQVFWPLDADWYRGRVVGYNSENNRHHIEYADGDKEDLILSNEKIKFLISHEEMQKLNLSASVKGSNHDDYDYNEMLALAASLDDCQDLEPGDIIWAKLTGHAMWPAVVVDASLICNHKGLNKNSDERSVYVQFFGTHDFARVKPKQVISFLKGLLSSFHLKCKRPHFTQSLEEAKLYLSEQKLPRRMLQLQSGMKSDSCVTVSSEDSMATDSDEDCLKDEGIQRILNGLKNSPYMIGDLQIISLGKIVNDSEYFQDGKFIWPEGYTASRKFTSLTDPGTSATYKMEVLRDAESKIRPIFLVTVDNGEQIKGSTPSACWNKIYKRMRKMQDTNSNGSSAKGGEGLYESGADMFGFSNPEVFELIKGLSKARTSSKSSCKSTFKAYEGLPVGYRPVRVDWKDLDKCSVCHMDEEYENNLFLQCDKCRIMVHSRCYGELKPSDGELWLCNLCRPGAPESSPPCCLCPVIGGAMKPTTDGRWAHLACAIWIPETCLLDIKRMEPIDGLNRISKDRWKLLCRICGVAYGACIQCSNNNCRVAYHPLCARAAGLCVELEDEDRLHLLSVDDEEESQCIRLLSFCKKHRPSNERSVMEERIGQITRPCSDYIPPCNPSGCARTEPYNFSGRRGRKEPEALAAASLKRLFVENQPYLVGGNCQHESGNKMHSNNLQRFNALQVDSPNNILSVAEKYDYMRQTFRKRLAFGKSGIHGFGIFAKHPHKAGDMVIEYTGELVRPPIADRREHLIYNSLVGAGTYMFRIDDERVIDATRAGSIAHLINHSCEPNCYSRVISVNGDEHIIIFAKRDIKRWEELTYDYRFFSIDEQLPCYCGFPRCRGVVNDTEERPAKLYVPRSELTD